MNQMQMKLENPARLEELKPEDTLKKIGLTENLILFDIGAGSGAFTLPAARITKNTVYALDIKEEMLSIIREKADREGLKNIETVKVENDSFNIGSGKADIAILVTVLHEISNKTVFLSEIKRILSREGRIAVIEFHKHTTQMGPPPELRLGKDDLTAIFKEIEFASCREFDMGENFYCMVFEHSL